MIKFNLLSLLWILLLISCSRKDEIDITGKWTGKIKMQGKNLPFEFVIKESTNGLAIQFLNGEENLETASVRKQADSLFIDMEIFDVLISARIKNNEIRGNYNRAYKDNYILPFHAIKKTERFDQKHTDRSVTGKYRALFSDKDGSFPAIGIFSSNQSNLTGTFLTETGDYRYLEGVETADSIFLSAYDGEHLFLFEAIKKQDSLIGGFWSGSHYYADWVAVKDESFNLTHPDSITFLKPGYDKISFAFPNLAKDTIRLSDYEGKPVILQLLGTWCPNCMDETRFLTDWYDNRINQNIELIGLAYETSTDFNYASKRVKVLKEKLNVNYPILIAGSYEKSEAAKTLPMLNNITSFPTTIFLDSNHDIVKIHTGFSGPGTGSAYEETIEKFRSTIKKLTE